MADGLNVMPGAILSALTVSGFGVKLRAVSKALEESEIRSLVKLLDEENPESLSFVRREILSLGKKVLPYLDEVQGMELSKPQLAENARQIASHLRFSDLKREFRAWAAKSSPDLEDGAFLVARFAYPGLDPAPYQHWLDEVAAATAEQMPSEFESFEAFQRLNGQLFHKLGFVGNETNYYDPDNSYLNRVIDSRRGIPVSLSVLYLLLCRRLRLRAYGVGAPGHFLVGFKEGKSACFVDTFHRGAFLDFDEARRLIVRAGYEFRPEYLAPGSARGILLRMVRNLISIYQNSGSANAGRLSELAEILLLKRPLPSTGQPDGL